ncbi:hypothetical protein [Actinomadura gamaensis]|uniref:Uncharacterized protein n=1 Tax=Actinomadura gamaensis TaxID=1763541 RepID=A0ABV9U8N7_9ACTN
MRRTLMTLGMTAFAFTFPLMATAAAGEGGPCLKNGEPDVRTVQATWCVFTAPEGYTVEHPGLKCCIVFRYAD